MLKLIKNLIPAFALLTLIGSPAQADESGFMLKGRSLGQSTEIACQGALTTDKQELVRALGIDDVLFPAESCDVYIQSVAGVALPEYANLLFWRGKLIRVVVRFGVIDLSPLAAIRGTLVETYGAPTVKRSGFFRTDIWKKGSEQLELERTDKLPSNVGLYLTHSMGWAEYEKTRAKVDARVEKIEKTLRQQDLKN